MATTTLTGTTGNDILNAPGSVTTLVAGFQGNDTITLALAGDSANAGNGNDTINAAGASSVNTINGGDGNDTITILTSVSNFGGSIDNGSGDDVLITNNVQIGGASIGGNQGNDRLNFGTSTLNLSTVGGGKGNDSLVFGAGNLLNSQVNGGDNRDTIEFTGATTTTFATVQAGSGHDIVLASAIAGSTSLVIGLGAGFDSIQLGATTLASLSGGAGNDTIRSTAALGGNVAIYGDSLGETAGGSSSGADLIVLSAAALAGGTSVWGGGGNDTIGLNAAINSAILIAGGDGNDVIGNTAVVQAGLGTTISGGAGNDSINLSTFVSANLVDGGAGEDTLRFGYSAAQILGSINGGDGNDLISFRSFSSALGSALIVGTINGGAGNDTIAFTQNITAGLVAGGDVFTAIGTSVIANVVYGAGDSILMTGSFITGSNWLATALYVSNSASGMTAGGFTAAALSNSVGSVGVFGNGEDLVFAFYTGSTEGSLVQYLNIIGGKSALLKTTAIGTSVTLNSSNFGFTIAASAGSGMQITFA